MLKGILQNVILTVFSYIIKRFVRIFPMYMAAYLLNIVIQMIYRKLSIIEVVKQVYHSFPEMFMLKINTSINGVTWFIAAMLISGMILWACLDIDKKLSWIPGFFLAVALLIYGTFLQQEGRIHLISTQIFSRFGCDGIWRVLADMAIGIVAFSVVQNIRKCSRNIKLFLSIGGNIGFSIILFVSFFRYDSFCDFWFIFIAWCAIICFMLSGQYTLKEGGLSKTICYLGRLSYPIYLLHTAIYEVILAYWQISNPVFFCIIIVLISLLTAAFLDALLNKQNKTIRLGGMI